MTNPKRCDKCGLVGPEEASRRAAELALDEMKKESKKAQIKFDLKPKES